MKRNFFSLFIAVSFLVVGHLQSTPMQTPTPTPTQNGWMENSDGTWTWYKDGVATVCVQNPDGTWTCSENGIVTGTWKDGT